MEIIYTPWGLANNYGDVIELNENLINHKELHDKILNHEYSHSKSLFSKKDFMLDLFDRQNTIDIIKFMIKYPKSLTQMLPFYFHRRYGLVYDINLIITYFIVSVAVGIGVFFALV